MMKNIFLLNKFGIKLSKYRSLFFVLPVVFVFFISCQTDNNQPATDLARELIEQSGIRGGLIVHLGSGEGSLTSELRLNGSYIVHGLERDPGKVEKSRRKLHDLGIYGPVSVDLWDGRDLPYAENLVNLIVAEDARKVSMDEVLRVLVPHGVILMRKHGEWIKSVKPWPDNIDEWTHYLHGPDNNAVADDSVISPPGRLQWFCPPRWSRSHEHLASLSAAVSGGGRLFYIIDKGPMADVAMPAEWSLTARDAFNGVLLWERQIEPWQWHLRPFRTGPPDLARRLVASDSLVYVTPGYGQPVVAIDAAGGQTRHIYNQTENAQEIIHLNNVLYLVIGEEAPDPAEEAHRAAETDRFAGYSPIYEESRPRTWLMAVDAVSGVPMWVKKGSETENIMPNTLAVNEGKVFFQNTRKVICLNAPDGNKIWEAERPCNLERFAWSTPTLVVKDGVVLSADGKAPDNAAEDDRSSVKWTIHASDQDYREGEIMAFSADNGRHIWSAPCNECFRSSADVLIVDGVVWSGNLIFSRDPGIVQGLDLLTGEVVRTRPSDHEFYYPIMGHARCYRSKATKRFLLTGRSGTEFVDVETGKVIAHHWVRGTCQYGMMPANGLLYATPHPCACFITGKLNSFQALAPAPEIIKQVEQGDRLEKGKAFNRVKKEPFIDGDWNTYRHDAGRSGHTSAAVSPDLRLAWEKDLPAPLTAPVAASGRVYVASREIHTLYALDVESGREIWNYTAGGRIDSPPTIWNGCVYFGSADGRIYCLRAADGQLVWRYLAAPARRMVGVNGQIESAWPVHGSVMVLPDEDMSNATVYASAGRSGYLDGGIVMVRLDAESGRELSRTVTDNRKDVSETGHPHRQPTSGWSIPGTLNDILSTRNNSVFMRHKRFTMDGIPQIETEPHLHSSAGFLDDSWWHRTYWFEGDKMDSGYGYWPLMGNLVPSGRIMVVDGKNIYGFGRDVYHAWGSHVGLGMADYRLFARISSIDPRRHSKKEVFPWSKNIDMYVRSMLLADNILFIAGPENPFLSDNPVDVWEGRAGGMLWALSADTGEKLAEYELDSSPVFDALIALPGRILLTATDGKVISFTPGDNNR